MTWRVECADVIEWAERYDGPPFHALLADPPYSLGDGKRGFMNRDWDTDVAFNPDTWAALAEHLLPGAFIMAFASSRGWHRLAVAIEDVGMRIFPSIFCWATGQSFPKATNLHMQMEKTLCEQIVRDGKEVWVYKDTGEEMRTEPPFRYSEADKWYGHRYGGQVLKNALEPIIVAQKPYPKGKKTWESITETGAGALNIDQSRIGTESITIRGDGNVWVQAGRDGKPAEHFQRTGRWPANFCMTHIDDHPCHRCGGEGFTTFDVSFSDWYAKTKEYGGTRREWEELAENGGVHECSFCHGTGVVEGCKRTGTKRVKTAWSGRGYSRGTRQIYSAMGGQKVNKYTDADGVETVAKWDCVPECPVFRLGLQAGVRRTGGQHTNSIDGDPGNQIYGRGWKRTGQGATANSVGSAARFFHQSDWSYEIAERLENADPVMYCSKSSRTEREVGLVGHLPCVVCGGLDTVSHIDDKGREVKCRRCGHPTVKPISLAIWLCKLLSAPPEYAPRRLLVPFSGVGSEICAAILTGCWEEIVGIELLQENVDIAEARCRFWQARMQETGSSDPRVILKARSSPGQMRLF